MVGLVYMLVVGDWGLDALACWEESVGGSLRERLNGRSFRCWYG